MELKNVQDCKKFFISSLNLQSNVWYNKVLRYGIYQKDVLQFI